MATLGVGPVIIGSIAQADLLAARTAQVQGVLLRMTNANGRGGSNGFGFPFGIRHGPHRDRGGGSRPSTDAHRIAGQRRRKRTSLRQFPRPR